MEEEERKGARAEAGRQSFENGVRALVVVVVFFVCALGVFFACVLCARSGEHQDGRHEGWVRGPSGGAHGLVFFLVVGKRRREAGAGAAAEKTARQRAAPSAQRETLVYESHAEYCPPPPPP